MEQIVRVKEAHPGGMATVLLVRESACSGDCHKCSGCGAAKETMVFDAVNAIGAQRGDLVVIKSETGPVMKAVGVLRGRGPRSQLSISVPAVLSSA